MLVLSKAVLRKNPQGLQTLSSAIVIVVEVWSVEHVEVVRSRRTRTHRSVCVARLSKRLLVVISRHASPSATCVQMVWAIVHVLLDRGRLACSRYEMRALWSAQAVLGSGSSRSWVQRKSRPVLALSITRSQMSTSTIRNFRSHPILTMLALKLDIIVDCAILLRPSSCLHSFT